MRRVNGRLRAMVVLACVGVSAAPVAAQVPDQTGVTARAYASDGQRHADRVEPSVFVRLRRDFSWGAGGHFLAVEPFVRFDPANRRRSRFDLIELSWTWTGRSWELTAGSSLVRWGVAESAAIVDVVNQLDIEEDAIARDRLGQPMVSIRHFARAGRFELLVMPFFRERSFVGRGADLWSGLPVDDDQSDVDGRDVDAAVRWSQIFGDVDVAVAHFSGRSREPRFVLVGAAWAPVYDRVEQTSLDAQWVRGAWLLKLEALGRTSPDAEDFAAFAGGLELALAPYLSLFGEYVYDGRGGRARTSLEHDVFLGARLLSQEWSFSTGVFVDDRSANRIVTATASRRLGASATADLDVRLFDGDPSREPAFAHRLDDFVAVRLRYFF